MILNTATLPIAPGRVATWPLGPEHLDLAARWLAEERNAEWLDASAREPLGDRAYDRLWFDLLAHEFKGNRKDDHRF